MTTKAILYKADGTMQAVEPENGTDFKLEEVYKLLGCDMVECTTLPNRMIMLSDEEALSKPNQLNYKATRLYMAAFGWNSGAIAGNALVCQDNQFR